MSKCWYCNNELTTGDNPKHFGICNKCYDEMFKSGDTIIRSLTNKIYDLEAKLAESEKKYAELFYRNIELETLYSQKTALLNFYKDTDLVEENQQLKQQLADKDKEIVRLNKFLQAMKIREHNQDKILFAVEQLTLFKNSIVNKMNNPYSVNIKHILSDFDNQIKELKGEE